MPEQVGGVAGVAELAGVRSGIGEPEHPDGAHQQLANLVLVPIGAGGAIRLTNASGATHLIAGVVGWVDDGTGEPAGATGVWAQDAAGRYQLLVLNGASFLRDQFVAQFPGGFTADTAVTLVR